MVLSASIFDSGISSTCPTVSNTVSASATSSGVARDPGLTPVTPLPTRAGVFGMALSTTWVTNASMVAMVTPAATLTTMASSASAGLISRSRPETIAGLTPMSTMRAPVTAVRFAPGSFSRAYAVTISDLRAAALASVRLVTRMPPSTVTDGASRPLRIAAPIEPVPIIAMVGRVLITSS